MVIWKIPDAYMYVWLNDDDSGTRVTDEFERERNISTEEISTVA